MNRILTCSLSLAMAVTTIAPLQAAPKDEREGRARGQSASQAPRAVQAPRVQNRTVTTPAGRINREIAAARESRPVQAPRAPAVSNRAIVRSPSADLSRQRAVAQQQAAQQRIQAQVQQRSLEQRQDVSRARATAQQRVLQQRAEAQQQLARQRATVQQRTLEQRRELAENRVEAERRAATIRQEAATDEWRRRADVARRSNELTTNRALAEARAERRDDDRRDRDWSDDDRRRWGRWDNDDRRRSWERYRYFRAPSWVYRNWDRNRSYWWNDHRYHWYGGNWVIVDPGYAYVESYSTPTLIGANLVLEVQSELIAAGYNPGVADGVIGPMTRNAIAQYQADRGLAVTGEINDALLASLGIS